MLALLLHVASLQQDPQNVRSPFIATTSAAYMYISADALQGAIPYLQMAEADFKSLEIYRSVKDVQYLLSVVYHNLGMTRERDEVASRHSQTEEHQNKLEGITFDPLYQGVFELVAKVGAALAARN